MGEISLYRYFHCHCHGSSSHEHKSLPTNLRIASLIPQISFSSCTNRRTLKLSRIVSTVQTQVTRQCCVHESCGTTRRARLDSMRAKAQVQLTGTFDFEGQSKARFNPKELSLPSRLGLGDSPSIQSSPSVMTAIYSKSATLTGSKERSLRGTVKRIGETGVDFNHNNSPSVYKLMSQLSLSAWPMLQDEWCGRTVGKEV